MRAWLSALVLVCVAIAPARADDLAAGLSTNAIRITSSFRGTDIVLFGAVASNAHLGDLRGRDIVVVLYGPEPGAPIVVRRKARIAGVWVNAEETRVTGMPGYYHLASTRPLATIADKPTLIALSLGAAHMRVTGGAALRDAVIRAKTRARLYDEDQRGVRLLGPHLFRARMRLPAAVPPGRYRAQVFLFSRGRLLARTDSLALDIGKAGVERRLADYAQDEPLPYGLAAVAMALALGWLGFAVFRER